MGFFFQLALIFGIQDFKIRNINFFSYTFVALKNDTWQRI